MGLQSDLTDAQWSGVEALFLDFRARKDPRGRPERNTRAVLNAACWILSTGGAWATLPRRYPDHRTCHRRFKAWFEAGVLQQALHILHGEAGDALCEAMAARMRNTRPTPQGRAAAMPGAGLRQGHHVTSAGGQGGAA
jgi:transposase